MRTKIIVYLLFVLAVNVVKGQEVITSGEALYLTNHAIINTAIGDYTSRNAKKSGNKTVKAKFTFTRSEALSISIQQNFINQLVNQQPGIKPALEKEFANNKLRNRFDALLNNYGYSGKNVADVMTAYLVITWQVVNQTEYNDRRGFDAVRKMITQNLSSNIKLAGASDADKQTISETFAYQSIIAMDTYRILKAQGNRIAMDNFRNAIYIQSKTSGFDMKTYQLTPRGFIKN